MNPNDFLYEKKKELIVSYFLFASSYIHEINFA